MIWSIVFNSGWRGSPVFNNFNKASSTAQKEVENTAIMADASSSFGQTSFIFRNVRAISADGPALQTASAPDTTPIPSRFQKNLFSFSVLTVVLNVLSDVSLQQDLMQLKTDENTPD